MSPSIHLHGLELHTDDALRLNATALQVLGEHINEATTFAEYETASAFLRASMLDAVTLMGASVADLVRWTELDPGVVLDLLGAWEPFSTTEGF